MAKHRTQTPFATALPQLLHEQDLSLRGLSRRLGVDPTYLSRVRRGKKRLPEDLPKRVAVALGLPEDYFPEAREAMILEAIRRNPDLREQLFRRISRTAARTRILTLDKP